MVSVAIDGPAGAGKSTIAKMLSRKLGFIYVDTGALYRSIGYYSILNGIDYNDNVKVSNLLNTINIDLKIKDDRQYVYINNIDVTDKIRTPEVSMAASSVSAIPRVREFLLNLQKQIAVKNNVIMDGRDIGTVVLPDAKVKIFLTASSEERAKRRYDDLIKENKNIVFEDVLKDIKQRDYNDSTRKIAPLKPADDAKIVDTTGETLERSVSRLYSIIKEQL